MAQHPRYQSTKHTWFISIKLFFISTCYYKTRILCNFMSKVWNTCSYFPCWEVESSWNLIESVTQLVPVSAVPPLCSLHVPMLSALYLPSAPSMSPCCLLCTSTVTKLRFRPYVQIRAMQRDCQRTHRKHMAAAAGLSAIKRPPSLSPSNLYWLPHCFLTSPTNRSHMHSMSVNAHVHVLKYMQDNSRLSQWAENACSVVSLPARCWTLVPSLPSCLIFSDISLLLKPVAHTSAPPARVFQRSVTPDIL